ncbi:MAG: FkbM family methyltransferase [Candidatus Nealsonbacteria bacterium]
MKFGYILTRPLYFFAARPKIRRFIHFFLIFFQPKKDVRICVQNQIMYARTLDRIVVLYLRKFRFEEAFETKLFQSVVKPGMTVVDIGANLGCYALIAADLAGEKGRVFAFEPDSENFSLLLKNIGANGYRNVKAFDMAISDKAETIKLFLSDEHRGNHKIYDSGEGRKTTNVQAVSLDSFFKKEPSRIDVIKMDVEGAEAMVFAGMEQIIRANPKIVIFIEFDPQALRAAGSSPEELLKTIKQQDFLIYNINEGKSCLELITVDDAISKCRGGNYLNLLLRK